MSKTPEQTYFENFVGSTQIQFQPLPQSGSARKNFIGSFQNKNYIITSNSNREENNTFLYFSKVFKSLDLNTPEIFSVSKDEDMYVQEFLGNQTLSEIIATEGISSRVEKLVKQSLEKLFYLQQITKDKIDYSKTFEYECYDEYPISYDLFYFKFLFVDILEVQYHKTRLLKEFKKIISQLTILEPKGLMIRDFQSRNIIVNEKDEVFFIDYQSAMKGPLLYDVVSFLYQAKANFSEEFKRKMLSHYISLWKDPKAEKHLQESLLPLQMIRFLQVLGVYGFRGLVQKKSHFILSINQGIENLYQLSQSWEKMSEYPELTKIITQLSSEATQQKISTLI